MTARAKFRILDEQSYKFVRVVDSSDQLLAIFGYDDFVALENYFWEILPEDVGDLYIVDNGDSICLLGAEIQMWCLEYPFSLDDLDFYLFEFDERATFQALLSALPDRQSVRDAGRPYTQSWLAEFCRTTSENAVGALGDQWRYLDHDPDGLDGDSAYYLWTGSAVIALTNSNIYLYRCVPDLIPDSVGLICERCEIVRIKNDYWNEEGPILDWLASFVADGGAEDAP